MGHVETQLWIFIQENKTEPRNLRVQVFQNIYDSEETKCVSISLFVHLQRGLKAWMFVSTTEEVAIFSSKFRFS